MTDLHENKSELVVLASLSPNQDLMKVNRWLMATVICLMAAIVIVGFFLLPSNNLNRYRKSDAADMNPVLSAEVNTLKGQFVGIVSGSIESKLRSLEESVRLGTAANALGTIEDIKNDVKILRSYSEPTSNEHLVMDNEQVLREMSQLKRLIYLTLGSCGLMFAAFMGIWLKKRYSLPYKDTVTRHLGKK